MHGLDNTTELGMNVIEFLQTVVTRLEEHGLDMKKNTLIDMTNIYNQHFEFCMKSYFNRTCTMFALSDPTDTSF